MAVLSSVIQVLTLLVVAGVMTGVMRRLIPPVGLVRCFLVSLLVIATSVPVVSWIGRLLNLFTDDGQLTVGSDTALVVAAVAFLWVFALSILVLVVLEVIIPTGSVWSPREFLYETQAGVRRARRYTVLAWIVATSGLSRQLRKGPDSAAFGQALVKVLNRAGVTFIKLGQIMSTRSDMIPPTLAEALTSLQTNAAPASPAQIRTVIRQEWDAEVDEVLTAFDDEPLAAASIAQVHRAQLRDGTPVVVKVQRPGAQEQVRVDADILLRFTDMAERRFDWARKMGLAALARGLVQSLKEELDYRREAHNTVAVGHALREHPLITTPKVITELVRERVLVMTELDGESVVEGTQRLSDTQRKTLANELLSATIEGVLVHGVFHADLHPGNILLLHDDRIGLLDFGAIGVIDAETRQLLATLLLGLLTDDNVSATTSLTMVFDVDPDIDRSDLQRDLGRVMTLLAQTQEENTATFAGMYAVLQDYGIAIPGDVAGAFRTLASLDGTLRTLEPSFGLFRGAQQLLPTITEELASSERVERLAQTASLTTAVIARRLPARAESITDQLSQGTLVVNSRIVSHDSDRSWVRSLVDDAVSALFAVAAIVLAGVFLLAPAGPHITPTVSGYDLLAAVLGFLGLILTLRLVIRLFPRQADHRPTRSRR